ncbi:MarR family transcriptional regulator [Microbacterium betulae]|uniref:MarR family transcriptional regulator n=1 Tax=Microbacterium betulae TaxID=2981139 RepID=A0AA97FKH6_9MICO|nr:MarR family transcriptional regulator [Microbacterium sp. AB]WOF23754.1 MarR family transcriptional regulator [Microbacterium sp. AB]
MTAHPDSTEIDISPVVEQDPLDLRISVAAIIHWADSREVRLQVMRKVDFPVDDVAMFVVVNQLAYRGALRPTDLASTLGTGKANVSKIVQRSEDVGLVVRVPSRSDERSVLVALTPAGRAIGERIMDAAEEQYRATVAGWDDQEIETLRRYFSRFAREAMAEMASRSPAIGHDI